MIMEVYKPFIENTYLTIYGTAVSTYLPPDLA
jgi:hypothetical protein